MAATLVLIAHATIRVAVQTENVDRGQQQDSIYWNVVIIISIIDHLSERIFIVERFAHVK
jgi:hypothetical protein